MIENSDSPMGALPPTPMPVVSQPTEHAFFLTGSLEKDLSLAALGGMGGSVVSFLSRLVDMGISAYVLFSVGQLAMYWGLLQVGHHYQLRWVRRGTKLLILANLIGWIPLFSSGFIHTTANWFVALLGAIGTVIAFVDLWGIRQEVNRKLLLAVCIGFIAEEFILAMRLTSQPVFQLIEAVDVGLLAWLFYEIAARNLPLLPTATASLSDD